MHYHAEIWVETPENLDAAIGRIMAPYEEGEDGNGFWDWWQIGGRYSGSHTDYDPHKDPANQEVCALCEGTGYRHDAVGQQARLADPTYTCNACGEYKDGKWVLGDPPGIHLKWPTSWAADPGACVPVSQIRPDLTAYTLIIKDKVLHQQQWNGKDFVAGELTKPVAQHLADLGITSGYLVTVDYHC